MMERWRLEKRFKFEASHQLPNHDGKCARLHGHSWQGALSVEGDKLHEDGPKAGMVIDFGDISKVINPLVEQFLDHHHLNETTGLENPTSEEIARWIHRQVAHLFSGEVTVRIEETCSSACSYSA